MKAELQIAPKKRPRRGAAYCCWCKAPLRVTFRPDRIGLSGECMGPEKAACFERQKKSLQALFASLDI